MVTKLLDSQIPESQDIVDYFLDFYFNDSSKVYEHCITFRELIIDLMTNNFLRKAFTSASEKDYVNFSEAIEAGKILIISTAKAELRTQGKFLDYIIALNFQSAVFARPGNSETRRPHFLYIDEFQVYSNPGFADMLTQGRSYRVASHLATQNRDLIGMGSGRDGKDFIELVSTNARNVILFPGINYKDAEFYSENENLSSSEIINNNVGNIAYKIIKWNKMQDFKIGKIK